jgi:transcription initiation factor IIE alpha subunit
MNLTKERGHVTDHKHTNANNNKQTLIRKVVQFLDHDKAITFFTNRERNSLNDKHINVHVII